MNLVTADGAALGACERGDLELEGGGLEEDGGPVVLAVLLWGHDVVADRTMYSGEHGREKW